MTDSTTNLGTSRELVQESTSGPRAARAAFIRAIYRRLEARDHREGLLDRLRSVQCQILRMLRQLRLLLLGLASVVASVVAGAGAGADADAGSRGQVVAQETARTQVYLAGRYCKTPPTGPCSIVDGISYDRHDIFGDDDPYNPKVAALYNKTTDHTGAECCGWCSGYANCTAWTICVGCKAPFTDRCYLKTSTAGKISHAGSISGLRSGTPRPPAPPPPADEANCIPWSTDPHNTMGAGFYWSANTCSMLTTKNDTLIAFLSGAKYGAGFHHQTDTIIRRSFDQGKTWQPFQMLFSPAAFYKNSTFGTTVGTVLDRHTGKIWAMLTGNNTFLAVMSSSDHGATWTEPQDLTSSTKAPGVGWVSTMDSGVQLASGRLAIPMDYIHGQWSSYPITHARSSVLYSDDHGATWKWPKGGGTADGLNMTECSLAVLPNNTMVLNARDYMGQLAHTVHRATQWSPDEGKTWSAPLYNTDLPSPVENGDMILGGNTAASLGIGKPLLLTHPQSELDRANGTLLMSTTAGASWEKLLQYSHGCHASSQLVQFADGTIGVLFDDGGPFPKGYNAMAGDCKDKVQQIVGMNETLVTIKLVPK